MKRLKKLIKKLWVDRWGLVQIMAYLLVVVWFGCAIRFIVVSSLWLFPKILLLIGGFILAFLNCIGLSKAFSEDEK